MTRLFLGAVALTLGSVAVRAEDAPASAAPAAPAEAASAAVSAEQLAQWIKELDADEFGVREEATRQLREAGAAAISALAEATLEGSGEAATRALDVLMGHIRSERPDLAEPARAALETIAASDHPAADMAKAALAPLPEPPGARPFGVPGLRLVPGAPLRIRVEAIGAAEGGGRRVSVRQVDGVKEVEAEEGGRRVKIREEEGAIQMSVTEKKDGKEVTEEFKAENAEQLKKEHPEAYKLYEQYSRGGGAAIELRALGGGFGGGIGGVPPGGAFPAPADGRGVARIIAQKQLEAAQRMLDLAREQLKTAAAAEEDDAAAKELAAELEELERIAKDLEAAQTRLGE